MAMNLMITGGYMYFHKAPGEKEFDVECNRLLDNIYLYDVKSDKSILLMD